VDILVWVDERLVYIPFVFVIGYLFLISVRKNSASAIYTVSGYGRTLKRRCACINSGLTVEVKQHYYYY
jgi:hypothetical protein